MYFIYQPVAVTDGKDYQLSFDWSVPGVEIDATVYYGLTSLAKMITEDYEGFNDVRGFNVAEGESGTKADTLTADAESEIFYITLFDNESVNINLLIVDNVSLGESFYTNDSKPEGFYTNDSKPEGSYTNDEKPYA